MSKVQQYRAPTAEIRVAALIVALLTPVLAANADELVWQSHGFVAARGAYVDAPRSWLDSGFGRLHGGHGAQGGSAASGGIEGRLQIEVEYGFDWSARLHVGLRADDVSAGRKLGLIEALVERRWFHGDQRWQLRAGQFFLPTSRENTDLLWVSPYTLTHSALNSWIGEEFRPVGAELSWQHSQSNGNRLELAATAFVGNDSSGALLAWRGFAWHDRLSFLGETLSLPPLSSLAEGGVFAEQNAAGTKPFGRDLDGRPGFAARARWSTASLNLQLTAVDNRGDRDLHRGEYAWDTRFVVAGFDRNASGQGWSQIAEILHGRSEMGPALLPRADIRFSSAYLMASYGAEPWRYSVRLEGFRIRDLDRSIAENNNESGWALTLAALYRVGDWRLGLEALYVYGNRIAAADEGAVLQAGGTQIRAEARYEF